MSSTFLRTFSSTPTIVHPPTDILLPELQGPVTRGGLLACGTVAWLVVENSVIIINTVNGEAVQCWRPPPEAGKIVHIVELSLGYHQFLVIGLDQCGYGGVAVLSPNTAKLLRSFKVPESITSIHAFCSSIFASCVGGYSLPDLFQCSVMECFNGVIAVGCHGGKVYLINLHLDLGNRLENGSFGVSKLCLIEENTSADKIRTIGEDGQHACLLLTRGKK